MYRFLLSCLLVASICTVNAQAVVDFENFDTSERGYLNGKDLMASGFESDAIILPNTHGTSSYGEYWAGWAISSTIDVETPSFENYSAITGGGVDGSTTYALGYSYSGEWMHLKERSTVAGMYVTNSTYAHQTIRDGNQFSKRFGGETMDDPDFFLLTVKGYLDGELKTDSVDFYLADYRFEDNTQDYIVDTWEWMDLSSLGSVDSLLFSMTSSDTGDAGINTPTYFCIDNVTTSPTTNVEELLIADFKIYPNPTTERLFIEWTDNTPLSFSLFNANGQKIQTAQTTGTNAVLEVAHLPKGIYFLEARDGTRVQTRQIVKY